MSCKFCDRPPFRTKIGLAVHMTDEHGVDSDGETDSDEELEEVGVVRRSSRDIPCHLDYRETDTNDEEEEASENEVSEGEMIEVIDGVEASEKDEEAEEDVSQGQGQKRDTASAELTSTPVSKVKKIKRIILGTNRPEEDPEDQNNNYVSNFIEETMEEFKKI